MLPEYTQVNNGYSRGVASINAVARVYDGGRFREMMSVKKGRPLIESLKVAYSNSVSRALQLLHLFAPVNSTPMCTNYGHVVGKGSWGRSGLPKCQECGTTINDVKELRKAHAHDSTVWPC